MKKILIQSAEQIEKAREYQRQYQKSYRKKERKPAYIVYKEDMYQEITYEQKLLLREAYLNHTLSKQKIRIFNLMKDLDII